MPAIPRAAPAPTLLAAPVGVAEALVAEALLALLEDVILAAVPEELALEAEALADEALALVADEAWALVADVALAVTELEAEEEPDLSETVPPETELGSLLPEAVREAAL